MQRRTQEATFRGLQAQVDKQEAEASNTREMSKNIKLQQETLRAQAENYRGSTALAGAQMNVADMNTAQLEQNIRFNRYNEQGLINEEDYERSVGVLQREIAKGGQAATTALGLWKMLRETFRSRGK